MAPVELGTFDLANATFLTNRSLSPSRFYDQPRPLMTIRSSQVEAHSTDRLKGTHPPHYPSR